MLGASLLMASVVSPPSSLLTELRGYWRLDGNANDVFGVSNGTIVGVGGYAAGKIGQGFATSTPGNSRIDVPGATNIKPVNFTVAAWLRFTSTPASNVRCVTDYTQDPATTRWILGYINGANFAVVLFRTNLGDIILNVASLASLGLTWNHYALSLDGSTVRTYVNGVLAASTAFTGVMPVGGTTTPICFGSQHNGGLIMPGTVDEVGIWGRVLTAPEIATLYNAGAGNTYPFNG